MEGVGEVGNLMRGHHETGRKLPIIWTDRTRLALETLERAMQGPSPLVVATAPPGLGKSTMIDAWAARQPAGSVHLVPLRTADAADLCDGLCRCLGLPALGHEPMTQLHAVLCDGSRACFIIDPADDLADDALAMLHELAELTPEEGERARFLLAGDSALLDRLRGAGAGRNVGAVTIPGLNQAATEELLRAALSPHGLEIDSGACSSLFRETSGVPAAILDLARQLSETTPAGQTIDRRAVVELLRTAPAPQHSAPSLPSAPTPPPPQPVSGPDPAQHLSQDLLAALSARSAAEEAGRRAPAGPPSEHRVAPGTLPPSLREQPDQQQALLRAAIAQGATSQSSAAHQEGGLSRASAAALEQLAQAEDERKPSFAPSAPHQPQQEEPAPIPPAPAAKRRLWMAPAALALLLAGTAIGTQLPALLAPTETAPKSGAPDLQTELDHINSQILAARARAQILEDEIAAAIANLEQREHALAMATQREQDLARKIDAAQAELDALTSNTQPQTAFAVELDPDHAERADLLSQLAMLRKTAAQLTVQTEAARQRRDQITAQNTATRGALTDAVQALEQERQRLSAEITGLRDLHMQLRTSEAEATAQSEAATQQAHQARAALGEAQDALTQTRAKLSETLARQSILEGRISTLEQQEQDLLVRTQQLAAFNEMTIADPLPPQLRDAQERLAETEAARARAESALEDLRTQLSRSVVEDDQARRIAQRNAMMELTRERAALELRLGELEDSIAQRRNALGQLDEALAARQSGANAPEIAPIIEQRDLPEELAPPPARQPIPEDTTGPAPAAQDFSLEKLGLPPIMRTAPDTQFKLADGPTLPHRPHKMLFVPNAGEQPPAPAFAADFVVAFDAQKLSAEAVDPLTLSVQPIDQTGDQPRERRAMALIASLKDPAPEAAPPQMAALPSTMELPAAQRAVQSNLSQLPARAARPSPAVAAMIAPSNRPPAPPQTGPDTGFDAQLSALAALADALAPEGQPALSAEPLPVPRLTAPDPMTAHRTPVPDATIAPALRAAPPPVPTSRAPDLVVSALQNAPGLGDLNRAERAALARELANGACLVDALTEATGTLNRHTLAVLMRDLKPLCPPAQ